MASWPLVIDICSDSDSDDFPPSPGAKTRPTTTKAAPLKSEASKYGTKPKSKPRTPRSAKTSTPNAPPVSFSPILDSLNRAQHRAVTSKSDTVAILAGPGSGKTHTLTSRVVWLIDTMGYQPQDIIVATFTVKAAREMKERIGRLLGDGRERKIVLGTFHSVARRYLASYGKRIGLDQNFSIVDDADSKAIITRIIKRLNLTADAPGARSWISKKKAKGVLGEQEAAQRGRGGKPNPAIQNLETIYAEYQKHLESLNLLDYDDLLVKCAELLRAHPRCVSNVEAVLIDEYQDTNGIQFELMKLFAQARRRITVVGDPDQSIYGWRSAEITNLYRFLHDFPGTAEISLEENYRSSQHILDTSLQVIQQDEKRYEKSLLPVHKKGTRPVLRKLRTAGAEADWIVSEIRRATLLCGGMLEYSDVAILVRSAFLSRAIETSLGSAGIPYRMIGGHKFFERAEIKILLDYLRVIYQPNNNDALARIINVPRRGVGTATIKSLLDEAEREKMSLWTLLTKHCRGDRTCQANLKRAENKLSGGLIALVEGIRSQVDRGAEKDAEKDAESLEDSEGAAPALDALVQTLVDRLQYKQYIANAYGGDEETRWGNVEEFLNLAREFMRSVKDAEADEELPEVAGLEQIKEISVLGKFLANVSLVSDADRKQEDDETPKVTISTIHAAKGLEWPVVFIPAAYTGSLPHSRSDDCDEERRLLYVAMTRAKCLLNVSYSIFCSRRDGEGGEDQELSLFLSPIADSFAEQGPSYDRGLLEEIGDILSRPAPADSKIYDHLPVGVSTEDDLFPADPTAQSRYNDYGDYEGGGGILRVKRQKTALPQYTNSAAGQSSFSFQRGYATTMESSSNFSVASLPGFTTASAHQSAMLAAEAETAREAAREAAKTQRAKAPPPGQQTIMQSFFGGRGGSENNMPFVTGKLERVAAPASGECTVRVVGFRGREMPLGYPYPPVASKPSGIPPELTNRRLGGVTPKIMASRPSAHHDEGDYSTTRRYAHFSSSPAPEEAPPPEPQPQPQPPQPPRALHAMQPLQYHGHHMLPVLNELVRQPAHPAGPSKPKPRQIQHQARGKENCQPAGHGGKRKGGPEWITVGPNLPWPPRKKPAFELARGGMAPMDKLRMPFKPPSVKREV